MPITWLTCKITSIVTLVVSRHFKDPIEREDEGILPDQVY